MEDLLKVCAAERCGAVFGAVTWVHDDGSIVPENVLLQLREPELGYPFEQRVADILKPGEILRVGEMIGYVLHHPSRGSRIYSVSMVNKVWELDDLQLAH